MESEGKRKKIIGAIIIAFFILSIPIGVYGGAVDWFFENDGVVDPSAYYQRDRRDEFSDNKPFFQWWYFTIKNLSGNRYYTFHYNLVDTAINDENEGVYTSFSIVDDVDHKQWHIYEKYDLNKFTEHEPYNCEIEHDSEVLYTFNETSPGVYHVTGEMKNTNKVWRSINCSDETYISWDLTLHRIYGWYGQKDSAWIYKSQGIIHWNTYGHDCEVEGSITINSTTYTFTRDSQYRAYADSNWGEDFPSGEPAIEYPWGWYYAGLPSSAIENELSIIAGLGFHDAGFPFGTCQGQFADIRLNQSTHIGVRQNEIWGETSFSLMETSSDGDLIAFDVDRSEWVSFTDEIGTALIPLRQIVTIVTTSYRVVLDYQSDLSNYNRLLFPHENYIFSDFEALGVNVHVTIHKHAVTYPWWDIFRTKPSFENQVELFNFWSDDGGLEYGYNLDS